MNTFVLGLVSLDKTMAVRNDASGMTRRIAQSPRRSPSVSLLSGFPLLRSLGESAYLPKRMVEKDIESGLLHLVRDAPVFKREAYATFPVRSPRLKLIEKSLKLVRPH